MTAPKSCLLCGFRAEKPETCRGSRSDPISVPYQIRSGVSSAPAAQLRIASRTNTLAVFMNLRVRCSEVPCVSKPSISALSLPKKSSAAGADRNAASECFAEAFAGAHPPSR
jgi:hypothetical protein